MGLDLFEIKERILSGGEIDEDVAIGLYYFDNKESLYDAAGEITRFFMGDQVDLCSIINAKSGRCPENCKWCAQSAHNDTQVEVYDLVSEEQCNKLARFNEVHGVNRFSLVTSGKKISGNQLEDVCGIFRSIKSGGDIKLCASMGLMNKEELNALYDSGVSTYHCNLETAPSFFRSLCTTHSIDDKIQTLRAASKVGMRVCSGGIIGMGESAVQRIEFAFALKNINVLSIPINILQPIKGTPLENIEPISDEDILTTIAVFRFIHPKAFLRFAGGRARLGSDVKRKALRIGINAAIVGDMLTTVGSLIEEDKKMFVEEGYKI